MRLKRVAAVLSVLAVIATAGCSSDEQDPTGAGGSATLRVAVTDAMLPFYYPWGVAQSQGFWKDEGLTVDILPGAEGSSEMMQQLIGGNADVAHPGPTVVFNAIEQGFGDKISVFGTWLYKQGFNLKVPPGSSVKSVDDLKGKTIGVSDLSGGEVPILKATLAARGLKEGDYSLLPIGGGEPQTIQALQKKQVDAYCTANKDFIAIEQTGMTFTDITFPEWASLTANVFVTTRDLVTNRAGDLEKYLRGLAKAVVYAHDHREEALAGMKKEYPEAFVDFDDTFSLQWMELTEQRIYLPDLVSKKALFTVDRPGIEGYADFLRSVGDISADTKIDFDALINATIAEKANNFDYASVS